ncbi:MAG TPA: diguanylate cyclase, partial [Clostridia bacterium]|nr:diguanylate cyclase [Clostridia bacterium]
MLQLISFAFIYAIMIFIWSFVYLNRSHDKINQSFLWFLSAILLWMVLCVSNSHNDASFLGLAVKTVYWYSMMNMSLFFLWFIHRLIGRRLDGLFWAHVALNTLTLFSRYLFPMDYSDPTFWRLDTPIVAPAMSAIFSLPVAYGLYLIIRQFKTTADARQKAQLRLILWGSGLACAVSIVSEYVLPALFGINTQFYLMFYAILIYVVAIFISIMKYRLMNIQSDYIFRKLFQNSSDGIVIIHRNLKILSINTMAKEVLGDGKLDSGDKITDRLPDYDFETNYRHEEMTFFVGGDRHYLSVTQYPIDEQDRLTAKLLIITDITQNKLSQMREKDILIEQSSLDPLTGLYNKKYFVEKYYAGKQGPLPDRLTIVFIDVDDFKSINDLYGHL